MKSTRHNLKLKWPEMKCGGKNTKGTVYVKDRQYLSVPSAKCPSMVEAPFTKVPKFILKSSKI
jgi:hypothetical protein